MRHYNSQFHKDDKRPCIFLGCNKFFNEGYSSVAHFYHQHRKVTNRVLKREFLLEDCSITKDNTHLLVDNPGFEYCAREQSEVLTNLENENTGTDDMTTIDLTDGFDIADSYEDFL